MFELAFDRVIGHEGGYTDDPRDRGNWTSGTCGVGECRGTKYGLSAMTYPGLDIKGLTVAQAKAIYRRDWWAPLGMDLFPQALAFQLFDASINHGSHAATRMLQRAVGVNDDGVIGPVTVGVIEATELNDLLLCFLSERLAFMAKIKTFTTYGRGWSRRIANNLKLAAEDN